VKNNRTMLIRWLYLIAMGHIAVSLLLPLLAVSPLTAGYHQLIEQFFWQGAAPAAARAQQIWWMQIFAATLQAMSVWILALIWIGNQTRIAGVWLWLLAGLLLWAPQDIYLSLQIGVLINVWIDALALLCMAPPLVALFMIDRRSA
jgi:hypothetical protein